MIGFTPVTLVVDQPLTAVTEQIKVSRESIISLYNKACVKHEIIPPITPAFTLVAPDKLAVPCAVIITGPARNGKNTMVEAFSSVFPNLMDISIVDPIYQICELLLKKDERTEVNQYLTTKSDDWRQFMFEMKESYRKYCDGPIHYIHTRIINHLILLAHNKAENPHMVCVQSRERADIISLYTMFIQMGIMPLTVYVSGQTTENDWKNDSDHNTDREVADIIIENNESLSAFMDICTYLATIIKTEMAHEYWPKMSIMDHIRLFNWYNKL